VHFCFIIRIEGDRRLLFFGGRDHSRCSNGREKVTEVTIPAVRTRAQCRRMASDGFLGKLRRGDLAAGRGPNPSRACAGSNPAELVRRSIHSDPALSLIDSSKLVRATDTRA